MSWFQGDRFLRNGRVCIWEGFWAGLDFFRDEETGVGRFDHHSQAKHWRKI